MNKKLIIVILISILVIIGICFIPRLMELGDVGIGKWKGQNPSQTEGINIALTLEDKVQENTIWCGTFQLIWNDLKNDLAKQDIVFEPQLEVVENLNKGTFKESDISDKYYYKVYGYPSLELKKEIEKAIKNKFNETSDILDDFDWNDRNAGDYFLYTMLRKNFEFATTFQDLAEGKFGNSAKNVKYFGFDNANETELRKYNEQIQVLYYNSKDDFAIKLKTKQEDEIVLCKNPKGNTFNEIYESINKEATIYNKLTKLIDGESLKIPNIKLNEKKEIKEIENKPFRFADGREYEIEKAIQTIQFELDKAGGKIKSEAGMDVKMEAVRIEDEPRQFWFNDTFAIFLVEEGKSTPYFAAKIDNASLFQK
ncbi:MAG: hypothetical protein HFJ24_06555 [Clostridia bacterium]|nr:hypothetical protein [Clostridia bacterium]